MQAQRHDKSSMQTILLIIQRESGNTTSAINAVQILKCASGNIDAGVIKMYGVS